VKRSICSRSKGERKKDVANELCVEGKGVLYFEDDDAEEAVPSDRGPVINSATKRDELEP